jgi:hypothetical protein
VKLALASALVLTGCIQPISLGQLERDAGLDAVSMLPDALPDPFRTCAPPWLLVALDSMPGRIARLELSSRRRCEDLGRDVLLGSPRDVVQLDDDRIVVVTNSHIQALSLTRDLVLWTTPRPDARAPDDTGRALAFRIDTPRGPWVAIATNAGFQWTFDELLLCEGATGICQEWFLPLGSAVRGVSEAPNDSTHVLFWLDRTSDPIVLVDPFAHTQSIAFPVDPPQASLKATGAALLSDSIVAWNVDELAAYRRIEDRFVSALAFPPACGKYYEAEQDVAFESLFVICGSRPGFEPGMLIRANLELGGFEAALPGEAAAPRGLGRFESGLL